MNHVLVLNIWTECQTVEAPKSKTKMTAAAIDSS
jgi:hypothetical protein